MRILITGAGGFIGKNLTVTLRSKGYTDVFEYDTDTPHAMLEQWTQQCDFVFHLAGINRNGTDQDFIDGNSGFTCRLLQLLQGHGNCCPILMTSSTQAVLDNIYGTTKKAAEQSLRNHAEKCGAKVLIYRLPGVFGKWCKPNYNSVVATFCHNLARGLDITINDPAAEIPLAYIDDVMDEFVNAMEGKEYRLDGACAVAQTYRVTVGRLADIIGSFGRKRRELELPELNDPLESKLYSTYTSYLPDDSFIYGLNEHRDQRGLFAEIIRTPDRGQISVNISRPGVTKGNHWHHTKIEKFIVVSGSCLVRLRKLGSGEILEYYLSGDALQVMDIPAGYTHSITNTGDNDMVMLIWASEPFDPDRPDTYYEEV